MMYNDNSFTTGLLPLLPLLLLCLLLLVVLLFLSPLLLLLDFLLLLVPIYLFFLMALLHLLLVLLFCRCGHSDAVRAYKHLCPNSPNATTSLTPKFDQESKRVIVTN